GAKSARGRRASMPGASPTSSARASRATSATSARTLPAGAIPSPAQGSARRPPGVSPLRSRGPSSFGVVGTAAPVIPNGASTRSATSCGYGRSAAAANAAPSTAKPRLEYVPGGASSGAAAAASRISGVEYGYGLPAVSVLHQPRTNAPAPPGTDGRPERWVASCSSVTPASGPGTGSSAPTVVVGVTSPRATMSAKSRPVRPFVIDPISKRLSG